MVNYKNSKHPYLLFLLVSIAFIGGCSSEATQETYTYAIDNETIQKGNQIFDNNCVACHNFKTSGIGPNLSGVTAQTSADWLKAFIKNPVEVIQSGDERAVALFERYGQYMPPYPMLAEEDLDALLAYLNTRKEIKESIVRTDWGDPIDNPIAEKIPVSETTLIIEPYAQLPFTEESGQKARVNKIEPIKKGSNRLFAHDLRGKLYEFVNDKPVLFLDLAEKEEHFIHVPGHGTGMGSFAFHPEYEDNGLFYTTHTEDPKQSDPAHFSYDKKHGAKVRWVLTEWKQDNPAGHTFAGSSREIVRIDMVTQIHGVQEIKFNPLANPGDEDYGLLYIGAGDGGTVGQRLPFFVEDNTRIYGSILRIDPLGNNSDNGQYGIPASNPFATDGDNTTIGEVYAYGFRNPHRFTWDPNNGNMLATCIGQHFIEELNLIKKGANYGWPEREGTFRSDKESDLSKLYPLPADDADKGYTYPVVQFDHDEALAICGGYVYTGEAVPSLKGKYIFGGIVMGRVFSVNAGTLQLGQQAPIEEIRLQLPDGTPALWEELTENNVTGHSRVDFRIGIDGNGELYFSTKANGKIFKVIGEVRQST